MAEREATSKTPSLPPSLPFSLSLSLDLPPSLPPSLSLFPPSSLSSNSPPLSLFFLLAGSSLCRVSLFCDFPSIYPSISPTYISFFDFPINACILARGSCLRSLLSSVPLPFPLSPSPSLHPSLSLFPLSSLLTSLSSPSHSLDLPVLSVSFVLLSLSLARSLARFLSRPPSTTTFLSFSLALSRLLARSLARSFAHSLRIRRAHGSPIHARAPTHARTFARKHAHKQAHKHTRAYARARTLTHTHKQYTHTTHTHSGSTAAAW